LIENVVRGFTAPESRNRREQAPDAPGSASRPRQAPCKVAELKPQAAVPASFDEIFLAHYSRIVGVLRRLVGDSGRAEELTSEAFLKLYRQPLPADPTANVPGWLYRTATNLGIDALRAQARRNKFEQDAARTTSRTHIAEDGFQRTLRSERQTRVRTVLADLKTVQAQLLLLRVSGHSYKELAAALHLEPGSVGTLLIRAESAFQQRYQELYGKEDL
jgi:RNA polymerase sigma-70 factor (ECF subfamily)